MSDVPTCNIRWNYELERWEQAAIQAVDHGEIGRAIRDRKHELRAFEDLR